MSKQEYIFNIGLNNNPISSKIVEYLIDFTKMKDGITFHYFEYSNGMYKGKPEPTLIVKGFDYTGNPTEVIKVTKALTLATTQEVIPFISVDDEWGIAVHNPDYLGEWVKFDRSKFLQPSK